ncbi:MerR family regulatory protein [Streptococcus gordonii]|nr:MerR family regulatory protein [Streptococcus gordonii]
MKIGEVSDLTNISMRSLRYYEENNINNYLVLLEIC